MARPSALLLSFASLLAVGSPAARAVSPLLTDDALRQPERVSQWLRQHPQPVPPRDIQHWLEMGKKASAKRNWSAATKAYGEAAIRFPGGRTLSAYADAELRMMGQIRARNKAGTLHMAEDLTQAMRLWQSALAAEAVIDEMSPAQETVLRMQLTCAAQYLRTGRIEQNCPPVQCYLKP